MQFASTGALIKKFRVQTGKKINGILSADWFFPATVHIYGPRFSQQSHLITWLINILAFFYRHILAFTEQISLANEQLPSRDSCNEFLSRKKLNRFHCGLGQFWAFGPHSKEFFQTTGWHFLSFPFFLVMNLLKFSRQNSANLSIYVYDDWQNHE